MRQDGTLVPSGSDGCRDESEDWSCKKEVVGVNLGEHMTRIQSQICLFAISAITLSAANSTLAQSVCLPLPRLLTTMPMGGTVGTQVEVTISGENIEDLKEMIFTHPGLAATPKLDASGQPEPNKYMVTIAADCPTGIHEARLMTRLGISSSRVFCVDTLPEVTRTTANTSIQTAMELGVNSIANAVMTDRSVDHYWFNAVKGHRYVVNCASRGIDSKLDAVLIIGDAEGRDLVVERRGGMLDFTVTADGRHVIKVHELTFKGGPAYYYRLSLQELTVDAPLPVFASTKTVNSFSWPPQGLAENAALAEAEPNNTQAEAKKISLPCDIAGNFFPAADVDRFEFTAAKSDVWWIEVASERLGRPTDPAVIVQRVIGEGAEQQLTDVAEFTDIASPMKPSSNGYAYDGPPFDGGSADIIGKLEIPEDGVYRLQLTDLFGGTRNDARNIYRLIIRKAEPDFAIAAWGLHMELRNGDRNALSKPLALRAGSTVALEVVAVRRDGFNGDIQLVMEGLPDGVTAHGLKIPAGQTRGMMLITADQNAPAALANVTFFGKSTLNEKVEQRSVHMAAMAWPIVDSWGEIPHPRLVTGLQVSVTQSEFAPITIAAEKKIWEVTAGEKLTIPLVHTRRSEFSGSTLQLRTSGAGFENVPRFDVSLDADQSQAVLDTGALKTPPGDYLLAFYGGAVVKYRYNPQAVIAAETAHKAAEELVTSATAELQKRTDEATVAASENKAAVDAAVAEATAKKQAGDAALTAAAAKLKAAIDQAMPKDTADIVLSEPIAIRVK